VTLDELDRWLDTWAWVMDALAPEHPLITPLLRPSGARDLEERELDLPGYREEADPSSGE
jgi:hypothetical protein